MLRIIHWPAFRMIKAGLALEQFRSRNLADKKLPRCLPVSEHLCRRGSTGSTETSGNFRLGKYFCPSGTCCNALVCTACPSNVCLHFCPDLPLRTISLTMRKMKGGLHTVLLSQKFHWCHRQRHHPAGGLCGHHVNHL